ncbi:MAG: hypothetical protein OQK13_00400 [Gammaproteobacteria bacterium]|nr:hypothetical protein [Gammaproteobacteria bacterium]
MIRAQIRMPVVMEKNGKRKQKLGSPEVMTFVNRAELNQYLDGILKGARVKLLEPESGSNRLKNPMMQRICGVA